MSFLHFDFLKKKTLLAGLFLGLSLSLFFSAPQTSYATGIPVVDIVNIAKEYVGDGIANFIAKMIIKQLTAQTVNWINSGFKGNPAFLTNPEQFFLNVGDNVASGFLSSSPLLTQLCSPFSAKIRLALAKNYLSDQHNYTCTLGKVAQNFDNFTNDFSQGGWDSFFSVTQTDANNPFGAYQQAQDTLAIQIGAQNNHYNTQLTQGNGFLSFESCDTSASSGGTSPSAGAKQTVCLQYGQVPNRVTTTGPDGLPQTVVTTSLQCISSDIQVYQGGQWVSQGSSGQAVTENTNSVLADCSSGKTKVATPGSVISSQLNKALGTTNDELVSADEINEVVSALMTQLVSNVVGGIGNGLRGLTQTSPTNPRSLIQQIADSSATTSPESTQFINNVTNVYNKTIPISGGLGGVATDSATLTIILTGDNPLTVVQGTAYVEPGFSAGDQTDGDLSGSVSVNGVVDTNTPGSYTLTYSVVNTAGNSFSVDRTVIVTPPTGQ